MHATARTRRPPSSPPPTRSSQPPNNGSRSSRPRSPRGKAKAVELHAITRQRALFAYTHASANQLDTLIGDVSGPVEAIRRQQLLDHANQADNTGRQTARRTERRLKEQQGDLEKEKGVTAGREATRADTRLKDHPVQAGRRPAGRRCPPEEARHRDRCGCGRGESGRSNGRRSSRSPPQQAVSSGGPGQIIANPVVGGSFQCPVAGAAFSDDFGGPTGTRASTMFVPTGTPAVGGQGRQALVHAQ